MKESFDLVVIGGGINGAGIARDAAGRGLDVLLCEKGDLAEGTSSRSGKLVHGGLRYLEYYEFRLVREALIEREVLLKAAPHIVWPMRFVLPHTPEQRPAWLIRTGLFLYDHLGGRERLPPTRRLDLRKSPEGEALKDGYGTAFEYSDCWVDDARLVILNARDAARLGAEICTHTRCAEARREGGFWRAILEDSHDGARREVRAKALVNAAGPWVNDVHGKALGINAQRQVRLVKGSHIVTKKFWQGDQAYLLQNSDRRVIFVNPYERDLTLIGTTDIPVDGDPGDVEVEGREVEYLLDVINRYFRQQITPADIVESFAGVRPLFDDAAENPSAVTRDYVLDVEPAAPRPAAAEPDQAVLLSIFGGKITTYRKLAEHALEKLAPFFPKADGAWSATAPLPGGDIADADFGRFQRQLAAEYPWLPPDLLCGYARRYGTLSHELLHGIGSVRAMGRNFGGRLFECEVDYLMSREWARDSQDILERRTKHGLHLSAGERESFADWLAERDIEAAAHDR